MGTASIKTAMSVLPAIANLLADETHHVLQQMDHRITDALESWAIFNCGSIFRAMTEQVLQSDLGLVRRLEHLANEEGCGAEIIRGFVGHSLLSDRSSEFQRHVDDEISHHESYAEMAIGAAKSFRLPAPNIHKTDPINDLGIDYSKDIHLLVASIHIGEIRNLMNMDLMIPSLAKSDHTVRQMCAQKMLGIRADEIAHIQYLSKLVTSYIESNIISPNDIYKLVHEYSQYWWEDVARGGKILAESQRRIFANK